MSVIITYILITHALGHVLGHARLWDPPARSTMWRMGFNTPVNTNDNELNCGGYENQWINLHGRCGVCGDPYQQRPRENEGGGKYATGIISRHFSRGEVVTLVVDVTANHVGYFEFRLCPTGDDISLPVTQSCLDKHPVLVIGSRDGRYHVKPQENGLIHVKAKLPETVVCNRCVLQWRYRTGNRWNCDRVSKKCGKGLGSQEEFYGCADISILDIRFAMSPKVRQGPAKSKGFQGAPFLANAITKTKIVKTVKSKNKQGSGRRSHILNDSSKVWKAKLNKSEIPNVTFFKSGKGPASSEHIIKTMPVPKQNGKPKPESRKKKLMRKLGGLLWTLLKSLTSTNRGVINNKIGLVNWDPIGQSFGSDVVYLNPPGNNKTQIRGLKKGLQQTRLKSDWPITKPTFVELQHDGEMKPMILSEFSFMDKLPTEKTKTIIKKPKTIHPPSSTCVGMKRFRVISGIDEWCRVNCKAGNCPSVMCVCGRVNELKKFKRKSKVSLGKSIISKTIRQSKLKSFRSRPSLPKKKKFILNCRGTGLYVRDKKMVIWCTNNCNKGFCPKSMCYCTS